MKHLVLFSALICLSFACDVPQYSDCDQSILACCDANLRTALNIDCGGKAIYENPECVETALGDTYYSSEDGAIQVCDAYNTFRTCLGKTARFCTNRLNFLLQGFHIGQSQMDEGVYNRFNYMCGAGLDTALRNIDEIIAISDDKRNDLRLCFLTFLIGVRRLPQKACQYLKELTGCYQLNFGKNIPEVGWFACEIANQFGKPFAQHCADDITCTSTP
ncbi:hypothetical protein M3Y97_00750200 [Aphelenchoides bicaudatus]|nr:hypothetical protein M3Y97_00750200 [Aphelenchoides bicaudatus]